MRKFQILFFLLVLLLALNELPSCKKREEAAQNQRSGQRAFKKGKFKESLAHLLAFKEYQPIAPDMDAYIGLCYLFLDSIAKAELHFKQGIEDMEKTVFYTNFGYQVNRGGLGVVCAYHKENDKAIKYLTEEEGSHTELHMGRLALIDVYAEQEEYDKAIAVADYAIRLISSYITVDQIREAVQYLRPHKPIVKGIIAELVGVSTNDHDALEKIAYIFQKQKSIVQELKAAQLKSDTEKAYVYYSIGNIYYLDAKFKNNILGNRLAKMYYGKAVLMDPNKNFIWYPDKE